MNDDHGDRGRAPQRASRRVSVRAEAPPQRAVDSGDFAAVLTGIFELPRRVSDNEEVRASLKARLERLPSSWAARLGKLLNLGRAAHERDSVYSSVPADVDGAQLDLMALCDEHTRSQQYLERGFAMVCADSADFDLPDARREGGKPSVIDRAWSHFGRELARSEPGEWSWFAHRSQRDNEFEKLYLRRGSSGWWSFSVGLDRPLKSRVGTERSRATKLRKMDHGSDLQSLSTHGCADRPALQRAMRSVHARLGIVSLPRSM